MFRDLSALPSCSETSERRRGSGEEGVYIHSHFAEGLFPYLFKHAPVNYLSRWAPALCTCTASIKHLTQAFTSPWWKCTLGHRVDEKGTHQGRGLPLRGRKQGCLRQNKRNTCWLTWVLSRGLCSALNYRWTLRVDHYKVYVLRFSREVAAYLTEEICLSGKFQVIQIHRNRHATWPGNRNGRDKSMTLDVTCVELKSQQQLHGSERSTEMVTNDQNQKHRALFKA